MRYLIQATDGDIGHVQSMLVDEETWAVRYMIVDTSNWWFGHQVLISPQWIGNVGWHEANVVVDLTQQAVKDAPPFDSTAALDSELEIGHLRALRTPRLLGGRGKTPSRKIQPLARYDGNPVEFGQDATRKPHHDTSAAANRQPAQTMARASWWSTRPRATWTPPRR